MKPVFQTRFGDKNGNCFAACVASVMECELEDVPEITSHEPDEWFEPIRAWLAGKGLDSLNLSVAGSSWRPMGYAVAGVPSPRGAFMHAVVTYGNKIVHDPHPEGGANPDEIKDVLVLFPADPTTISSLRSQVAAMEQALGKAEEALENIPPHIRERLADPAYTAALEYIAEHLQGAMDSAMATDGWSTGYPHRAEKTFRHAYWKFRATRQAATGSAASEASTPPAPRLEGE